MPNEKEAVETAKRIKFDKMAFIGAKPFERAILNLMLKASRQSRRLEFFNTAEEAEEWLKK